MRGGIFKKDKKMNIFSIKKTEIAIKEKTLTEKLKFKYFFILCLFSIVPFLDPSSSEIETQIPFKMYYDMAYVMVILLGLYFTYKTNEKNDNQNYIERFILLSLPTVLSTLVMFLIIAIPVLIGISILTLSEPFLLNLLSIAYLLPHVISMIIFKRISTSLTQVAL